MLAFSLAAIIGTSASAFAASWAWAVPRNPMNFLAVSRLLVAAETQKPSIGASRASDPIEASSSGKVKKSRSSAWSATASTTNVPSRYIPDSPLPIDSAACCQVRPSGSLWW